MAIFRYDKQFFALIFSLFICHAQAKTEEDGRRWLNLSLAGELPAESWAWTLDIRPRWRDEGHAFDQVVASAYVIKHLNDKTSLGLGIDHAVSHPASAQSFEENRLTPQLTHKFDAFLGVKLTSRTRLEFRHREHAGDTAYRFREQIRAMKTLPKLPRLSLVASNELMLNLNNTDWNVRRGVDQNRAFVGVNWKTSQQISVDFGYQNQYVNTRHVDRINHVLLGTLFVHF